MQRPRDPYTLTHIMARLRDLEAHWPEGLYLFGGPHSLSLARWPTHEEQRREDAGDMPVFFLAQFTIPADGGDPTWRDCSEEVG